MFQVFRHIRRSFFLPGKVRTYFAYALGETVLITLGVVIALQLSDWNQARQDRQVERTYLTELLEDFQDNRKQLQGSIERLEAILTAMVGLLQQSALETPTWTVDELNQAFTKIHDMPVFTSVDRVYANLVGSGDLKILRNRELKNALALYQSAFEVVAIVQNTHEMELVQTFQPYVIENMDYQAVNWGRVDDFPLPPAFETNRILHVLQTRTFRNVLTQKWTISSDLLDQHRNMLIKTEEIIRMLSADTP